MAHASSCFFSNIRQTENEQEFEQAVAVTANTTFLQIYYNRAPCRIKIVVTFTLAGKFTVDHITQAGTRTTKLNGGAPLSTAAQEILYYDVGPESLDPTLAVPHLDLKYDTTTTAVEISVSEIDGASA